MAPSIAGHRHCAVDMGGRYKMEWIAPVHSAFAECYQRKAVARTHRW